MMVLLGKFSRKETTTGEMYWNFAVELTDGELSASIGGWKYFPSRGTVGTPSISKGAGKGFINLVRVNKELYNLVLEKAIETLGHVVPE